MITRARPFAPLLALLALGSASSSVALPGCTPPPPPPPARSAEPASTSAPRTAPPPGSAPLVTPAACRAVGLPPLTITAPPAPPMVVSATPDAHTWLRFSGPPGGPLGLSVRRAASEAEIIGADDRARGGFTEGKTGTAQKDGATWSVRTWVAGGGMASTASLALWRRIGDAIVVIEASWGAKAAPEASLEALPRSLRDILDGLTLTAGP